MSIRKRIAAIGAGAGLFAASLVAGPLAGSVGAAAAAPADFGFNDAIEVQTDLNCSSHSLMTKIKNKTDGNITPDVTFNRMPPSFDEAPIEPGKTGIVTYDFSGNNMPVDVSVAVDGHQPVELKEMLQCDEPVSFLVTNASESGVGGMLTNNSPFVAQAVIGKAGGGAQQLIDLGKNETRYVPLPSDGGYDGQQFISVMIGNTAGFSSTYNIDLEHPFPLPPIPTEPVPIPKD